MRNERFGRAIAIVGMQFGSEGKGAIASYLAPVITAAVRIGASNAGHTIHFGGRSYLMRQVPCSWVNPLTKLVIGVGAVISLPILLKEVEEVHRALPIKQRLYIDGRAHVITADQIRREAGLGLAERIASTSARSGLGIGMAMSDKVLRSEDCVQAKDVPELRQYLADTVDLLNGELEQDQLVLFEGTQGFGLSLEFGAFPYTTSRDTSAPGLFAGTGVNPYGFEVEVIGVARTYPIRVGGDSGPFGDDARELSWVQVTRRAKSPIPIREETSVTHVERRVATFSWQEFKRACRINRPTEIVLTHADYLDASVHGSTKLTQPVRNFIERLESETGVPVTLVKTAPEVVIDFDGYRRSMLRKLG